MISDLIFLVIHIRFTLSKIILLLLNIWYWLYAANYLAVGITGESLHIIWYTLYHSTDRIHILMYHLLRLWYLTIGNYKLWLIQTWLTWKNLRMLVNLKLSHLIHWCHIDVSLQILSRCHLRHDKLIWNLTNHHYLSLSVLNKLRLNRLSYIVLINILLNVHLLLNLLRCYRILMITNSILLWIYHLTLLNQLLRSVVYYYRIIVILNEDLILLQLRCPLGFIFALWEQVWLIFLHKHCFVLWFILI